MTVLFKDTKIEYFWVDDKNCKLYCCLTSVFFSVYMVIERMIQNEDIKYDEFLRKIRNYPMAQCLLIKVRISLVFFTCVMPSVLR